MNLACLTSLIVSHLIVDIVPTVQGQDNHDASGPVVTVYQYTGPGSRGDDPLLELHDAIEVLSHPTFDWDSATAYFRGFELGVYSDPQGTGRRWMVQAFGVNIAAATSYELGVGDVDGPEAFQIMYDAVRARGVEPDYMTGWVTDWGPVEPVSSVTGIGPTPSNKTMRPTDPCGDMFAFDGVVHLSDRPWDGVMWVEYDGVPSSNQLCLYADIGLAGPLQPGHAYVELIPTDGEAATIGFYPSKIGPSILRGEVDGVFSDDRGRAWNRRICWLLDDKQYDTARRSWSASVASLNRYLLLDVIVGGPENCMSWAATVVQAAGMPLPVSVNQLGYFDPFTLYVSMGDLVGMPDALCGLVSEPERGPGDPGDPIDYSPGQLLSALISTPAEVAGAMQAEYIENELAPVSIAPGGTIEISVHGHPFDDLATVVEWGDGSSFEVVEVGAVSHQYDATGVYEAVVVVVEAGSIQRWWLPIVVESGFPMRENVGLDVEDYEAVIIDNGPFTTPKVPPPLDVRSCATDCNDNGIPDCDEGTPTLDCNDNGVLDSCDIASGTSGDVDGDGIPDECEEPCLPDLDGDGLLTIFDFLAFQNLFDAGDLAADFDGDGRLTLFDFLAFQNAFDSGC